MFSCKCILIFSIYIGGYISGLLHFFGHFIVSFRYSEVFNYSFIIAIWNGSGLFIFYKIPRTERKVSGKT